MVLPEFLKSDAGEVFLEGHRICLHHVVQRYNAGASPEMLVLQYPTVPLALVHKVIAFYLENRVEVDAYVSNIEAEVMRQASQPRLSPSAEEMQKRLASKQIAKSA